MNLRKRKHTVTLSMKHHITLSVKVALEDAKDRRKTRYIIMMMMMMTNIVICKEWSLSKRHGKEIL